jgi:hypothetical protein
MSGPILTGVSAYGVGASMAAPLAAKAAAGAEAATDPAAAAPSDRVTLSPAAERLRGALQNLSAREASPETCNLDEYLRVMHQVGVTTDRRPAADAQIAALEATDKDHARTAREARAVTMHDASESARYPNPFKGMDRVALTAIATDETGLYVDYERDAAVREMGNQQQAWIRRSSIGGPGPAYWEEAKRQYGLLSAFERSCYPPDYSAQCDRVAEEMRREEPKDPFWWMNASATADADAEPRDLVEEAVAQLDGRGADVEV